MGEETRAPAALGLRAHSGWAALVAVGGTARAVCATRSIWRSAWRTSSVT